MNVSKSISKVKMLYVNFSVGTHPSRAEALSIAQQLKNATIDAGVDYKNYLLGLSKHKFCLCPRSNGIDTSQFWEAQYLDCIPIILYRDWIPAYSELPVLLLDSWEDLKSMDLEKIYILITNKMYSRVALNIENLAMQLAHEN